MAEHLSPENQNDGLTIEDTPAACQPPRLDCGIVVNSRISLSRNIAGYPFFDACSAEQRNEIRQIIVDHARFIQTQCSVEIIDCQQLKLLEHQFQLDLQSAIGLQIDGLTVNETNEYCPAIGKDSSESTDGQTANTVQKQTETGPLEADSLEKGLHETNPVIDPEKIQVSLFLNHEEHLQIQVETQADGIFEIWKIADQIDDTLHHHLSFAFHSQLGFLTSCPSLVGTGMKASVVLHLPACVATGNLPGLMKQLAHSNVVVREVFGDPGGGEFFRVSNQATLGFREIDLLEQVRAAVSKAIELETESRQLMLSGDPASLEQESRDAIRELESVELSQAGLSDWKIIRALSRIRLGLQLNLLTHAETNVLTSKIAILHLKDQLRRAIANENYRTASQLRDRINLLSGAIV